MSSPATEAELITRIVAAIERVDALSGQLQTAMAGKINLLPAGLRTDVTARWNAFCALLKDLWDFWYEVATHMGSPSRISAAAREWSERVGGPVSAQVQNADQGQLTVDDHWDGTAADAYRQRLPLQKAALQGVKASLTDGISIALSDVEKAIIAFWVSLLLALVALVVGIAGALTSSATIIGLPAAPLIAAVAVASACASIIGGGMILKSVCTSASITLRQRLDDQAAYPGGHWPPATTN